MLASTLHHDDEFDPDTRKPKIIEFYNLSECGVDLVDEMSALYDVSRNSRRWPLILFFSLLNNGGIDACHIYQSNNPTENIKSNFLKQRAFALIEPYSKNVKIEARIIDCYAIYKINFQDMFKVMNISHNFGHNKFKKTVIRGIIVKMLLQIFKALVDPLSSKYPHDYQSIAY